MRIIMNNRLRIKIITLVGLICAILPLHATKTFEDIKKEAIPIVQGMVAADKDIIKKIEFEASFITFIEGLSDYDDNEQFLNTIKSFKKDTRTSFKSLYNFISYLIYRIRVVHLQCFINLIKVLPKEYFFQHHFNWLRFSLKSGKIDYLTYLFDGCDDTFPEGQLMKLYSEKPYRGLNSPWSEGFDQCHEFLRKRLKLKSDCSQSDEDDSESDVDKLFVDESSADEREVGLAHNDEQHQDADWSDQSDEEDSESDVEKWFIDESPYSSDGDA